MTHTEVLKRFSRCELQQQAESGAIPKMFETKSDELAALTRIVRLQNNFDQYQQLSKVENRKSNGGVIGNILRQGRIIQTKRITFV